jgi:hypothetical protein
VRANISVLVLHDETRPATRKTTYRNFERDLLDRLGRQPVTFEDFDLSYVDDPLGEKGDTVLEGARAEWKTGEGGSLFRIRVGRV